MVYKCQQCERIYSVKALDYQCECGGLFSIEGSFADSSDFTVSLGERTTPLLKREFQGVPVHLKLEYLSPTGSFKDRGAYYLINTLYNLGVREVVEDSSGNGGAAVAGYCAAAGIKCHIFVPDYTSYGKVRQIEAYGAVVHKIPGSRDDTTAAVREAAKTTYYASHIYSPLFYQGVTSIAREIFEQIGVPDLMFVPVGNGSLLLGLFHGFQKLGKIPRLIGVQAANCSPLYAEFYGLNKGAVKHTLGEGIAIPNPVRIDEMVNAVRKSGGEVLVVSEDDIADTYRQLGALGVFVEPTSAVSVAGMKQYFRSHRYTTEKIVIPLTGNGLKSK